jgi:hypothetical protein
VADDENKKTSVHEGNPAHQSASHASDVVALSAAYSKVIAKEHCWTSQQWHPPLFIPARKTPHGI